MYYKLTKYALKYIKICIYFFKYTKTNKIVKNVILSFNMYYNLIRNYNLLTHKKRIVLNFIFNFNIN